MKISVAIPCYEMYGRGAEMVQHSLEVFKKQTFKDFEVVISDQSKDDAIENVCKEAEKNVNIKYIRNDNPEHIGSSGGAANFAMLHCNGDLIKILHLTGGYMVQSYTIGGISKDEHLRMSFPRIDGHA